MLSSFAPIVAPDCRWLILGSMPGVASLRAQQYYAHPHNQFWRIMGDLFGASPDLPYIVRTERLIQHEIALWDVLAHCEREGSLDTDIDPASEVPNDFAWLFARAPHIRTVLFNGKKSESVFRRRVLPTLANDIRSQLTLVGLPSTSPAMQTIAYPQKLGLWREALSGVG